MMHTLRAAALVALAAGVFGTSGPVGAQEEPGEEQSERLESGEIVIAPDEAAWRPAAGSWLGVAIENLDAERAEELGLGEVRGVRVSEVTEDSPAAEAGIREGDVILRFDGEEVRSARQLVRLVRETPPGRQVEVRLVRDGDRRTVSVKVAERSASWPGLDEERMEEIHRQLERARDRHRDAMKRMKRLDLHVEPGTFEFDVDGDAFGVLGERGRLGLRLQGLTDQLAEYFGVEGGALVASVREDSPAAQAGIRAGDVVVRIGEEDVRDPGDAVRAVRAAEAGPVTVAVVRDGGERTVTVELPAKDDRGGGEN